MSGRTPVEVAEGVFVWTSRLYTTSSTAIVRGHHAILVDPAWTRDELDGIAEWLAARRLTVTDGLATHAHYDHLLWHPDFGAAPRWAAPRTCALAREHHDELRANLGDGYPNDWPRLDDLRPLAVAAGPVCIGGEEIEVVTHDGHAPGHLAVLLGDRGVLLAGDMLSDVELPLPFGPDDLPSYLDALDRLAPLVGTARLLVPGHGHPTGAPLERLDADRRYLDALLRGDDPDDRRRALPGMAETHEANGRLARALLDGDAAGQHPPR